MVQDGDSIMLDASSTVRRMIKYLSGKRGLKIITNNLRIFSEEAPADAQLYCTGGLFNAQNALFYGAGAERYLRSLYADKCFFSSQGISEEGKISDASEEETALRRVMLSHAERKIFLCDASKIGVKRMFALCGKEDVDEITDTFRKFYESKGVKINKKPEYSAKDIEALARHDADEIIRGGDEDVADEFDRLEALGTKMTKREQETFRILAEHLQGAEQSREFAKLGVTEDVYNSKEFKDFSKKFVKDTPIAEIYQIYAQTKPKKEIKPMGSMKNSNSADNGVKEFYTIDEARKFTQKDFEKNPKLFEQVVKSSHQWNNR
jgi:hypothetical protein